MTRFEADTGPDTRLVDESFGEVVEAANACGGVAELVEQGELTSYPWLEHALSLIAEENRIREEDYGMPPERSQAINLGAKIMALIIKRTLDKQDFSGNLNK